MKISRAIMLGLLCLVAASVAQAQLTETRRAELQGIAQSVVRQLAAGEFAAVWGKFNAELKQSLPQEKIKAVWQDFGAQAGAFKKQGEISLDKLQGVYDVAAVRSESEKSDAVIQIGFDGESKIISLWINPLPKVDEKAAIKFKPLAKAVIDKLAAGDFACVRADFNEMMRQGLSVEQLRQGWEGLAQNQGAFKRQVEAKHFAANGFDVVATRCVFERGDVEVRVAFKDGKIGGLYLLPLPPR